MTPAYSPQAILCQIDNRLIDTYAKRHGLFPDLDIPALKQTEVEPIYQAILQLNNPARELVETDLRRVDAMTDKSRIAWLFKAIAAGGHSIPEFHKKRGFHDKAIWALLEHSDIFEKVLDHSFPNTSSRHWKNIPYPAGCQHHLETQHLESLQAGICEFFQKRDGRAQHCKVVHSHFDGKEYLIAYPSDYPEKIMEWLDKLLTPCPNLESVQANSSASKKVQHTERAYKYCSDIHMDLLTYLQENSKQGRPVNIIIGRPVRDKDSPILIMKPL